MKVGDYVKFISEALYDKTYGNDNQDILKQSGANLFIIAKVTTEHFKYNINSILSNIVIEYPCLENELEVISDT